MQNAPRRYRVGRYSFPEVGQSLETTRPKHIFDCQRIITLMWRMHQNIHRRLSISSCHRSHQRFKSRKRRWSSFGYGPEVLFPKFRRTTSRMLLSSAVNFRLLLIKLKLTPEIQPPYPDAKLLSTCMHSWINVFFASCNTKRNYTQSSLSNRISAIMLASSPD